MVSVGRPVGIPTSIHMPPEEWGKALDGKPFLEIMAVYGYTDPMEPSEWEEVLWHHFIKGREDGNARPGEEN